MEILRLISSGSKSVVVLPSSTLPSRVTAPAACSSASTSDVLPTPPCPTIPTLRILPTSIIQGLLRKTDTSERCYHRIGGAPDGPPQASPRVGLHRRSRHSCRR